MDRLKWDELGWIDPSGFPAEPAPCFMCQQLTNRVDVNFEAHFCNGPDCNKAIDDDLRRLDVAPSD